MLIGESVLAQEGVDLSAKPVQIRNEKILSIEWLGQTAASVFWIGSIFTNGLNSNGDWLQLFAASSWLFANIATVLRNLKK